VHVGVVCAVETSPEIYHRVQIDQILAKDKTGSAVVARVRSLDEGWRRSFKVTIIVFQS